MSAQPTCGALIAMFGALIMAAGAVSSCGDDSDCVEDPLALVPDETITLRVGEQTIDAEVVRDEAERERGWRYRRCDREALWIVLPQRAEIAVDGCGLTAPIDVYWVRAGAVVGIDRGLGPCTAPCGGCPVLSSPGPVDAVLETGAGALDVDVGDSVTSSPDGRIPQRADD